MTRRARIALYAHSGGEFEHGIVGMMPAEVQASGQTLKVLARNSVQRALSFQPRAEVEPPAQLAQGGAQ